MSHKEYHRLMKQFGFEFLRQAKGSHQIWVHPSGKKITVAGNSKDWRMLKNLRSQVKRLLEKDS
jgi:predicted RNA binding protein YcfA (HicA-like mRNA interferase family)